MLKLANCSLLLLLIGSAIFAQEKTTLSPRQVLDKMVSVYASCKTYSDTGRVKTIDQKSRRIVIKSFSTAFVRPSKFRFEFHEISETVNNEFVAWQDGASVKSWWSIRPPVRLHENIAHALSDAAGISSGSSTNVPSMLKTLGDAQRIQKLSQLKMTDDQVDGRRAYKVEGTDWRGNPMTIWIEKESFLLLKVFEKVKRLSLEATTYYKPRIDQLVKPDELAFKH